MVERMGNTILVIDDMKFNRVILSRLLEDEYDIQEVADGQEGLDYIEKHTDEVCCVLLDLIMPVMGGVDFLKIAARRNYLDLFPVIVVTGEQEMSLIQECFDYGISDFIRKPINTEFVKSRVDRLVTLYRDKNSFKALAEQNANTVSNQYKMLQAQATKLKETNDRITKLFGTMVEYRNLEGGNHVSRVQAYSRILAEQVRADYPEYGLTPRLVDIITTTSALHDVGKIMIPDHILLKPGKLTDEEYEVMKSHSIAGYDVMEIAGGAWDEEYLKVSREMTRWHHEKYDGKGYPDHLVGDDIPISAQIVSLADCYDSLTTDSVYREAFSLEEAYYMIRKGNCGVFSPKLLMVFAKVKEAMEQVAVELQDKVEEIEG